MDAGGAVAGVLVALVVAPLLAGVVHSAPLAGPWWAPWRPTGRTWSQTSTGDRLAVTAGSVLGAGLAGGAAGWGAAWPGFVVVGLAAGPLAVVDLRLHRLPDRIVAPTFLATTALLALAAVAQGDSRPLLRALISAVAAYLVLRVMSLLARAQFGRGDVKTGALLALPLGWISVQAVALGLWAGFVVASLGAGVLLLARRASWRSQIAFGPALLLGALGTAAALAG